MSLGQNRIDAAVMREARIGLMVLSVLIAIFLYVAFGKLSGWNQAAPVAFQKKDQVPRPLNERAKPEASAGTVGTEFGGGGPVTLETPSIQIPDPQPDVETDSEQFSYHPIPGTDTRREVTSRPDHASHPLQHSFVDTPEIMEQPANQKETQLAEAAVPARNAEFHVPLSPLRGHVDRVSTLVDERDVPVQPVAATGPFKPPVPLQSFIPSAESKTDSGAAQTNRPFPQSRNQLATAIPPGRIETDNDFRDDIPDATMSMKKDSFWLISQRVYGDGRFFDALYKVNLDRVASFNEIPEGIEILTPAADDLRRKFPRLCPREEIVTREGDTLFEISAERMGQASRYVDLLKLNYRRLPKDVRHDTPLAGDIVLELPR